MIEMLLAMRASDGEAQATAQLLRAAQRRRAGTRRVIPCQRHPAADITVSRGAESTLRSQWPTEHAAAKCHSRAARGRHPHVQLDPPALPWSFRRASSNGPDSCCWGCSNHPPQFRADAAAHGVVEILDPGEGNIGRGCEPHIIEAGARRLSRSGLTLGENVRM